MGVMGKTSLGGAITTAGYMSGFGLVLGADVSCVLSCSGGVMVVWLLKYAEMIIIRTFVVNDKDGKDKKT